ncbi:hypothetical protein ACET3Z_030810 [Daucus carota]
MANNMALHWAPPPPGAIKINVHGHTISSPLSNGNSLGIGAIFITSGAEISLLTTSAIPALTPLGNQLWAMYVPLRRAVVQEYDDLRLETDNYEAYMTIKHFHVDDLGLGQLDAPRVSRIELEPEELEDLMEGAVEDSFVGSLGPRCSLLAHEPPFPDLD